LIDADAPSIHKTNCLSACSALGLVSLRAPASRSVLEFESGDDRDRYAAASPASTAG
jgi:hypothetical protein